MTYIKGERLTYPEYQRLGDREKERLARDEAEFLRELHAVPTDCLANQFPHSVQNKRQQFENDQRELFPILRDMDLLTNELQRS